MKEINQVKFEGLFQKKECQTFLEQFQPEMFNLLNFQKDGGQNQIQENLKMINPTSGLSCFIRGFTLENQKENWKADFQSSSENYVNGVQQYLDPLCAYRLADIYSDQKNASEFGVKKNKQLSYFYLVLATYLDISYLQESTFIPIQTTKTIIDEFDKDLVETNEIISIELKELPEQTPLKYFGDAISFYTSFQVSQVCYDQMINSYLKLITTSTLDTVISIAILHLIQIITSKMNVQDKKIELILGTLSQYKRYQAMQMVTQILFTNIQIMSNLVNDNEMFSRQREQFLESIFLVKNILGITTDLNKFVISNHQYCFQKDKLQDFIKISPFCAQIWTNIINTTNQLMAINEKINKPVHKALVIRIDSDVVAKGNPYANLQQNYEDAIKIQLKELQLQKASKYAYALAYYHLAKLYRRVNKDSESESNLKKANELFRERIQTEGQMDIYTQIISLYYLSRISRIFRNNKEEQEYLKETNKVLTAGQALKLVRTIQYHTILKKVQTRLPQIQLEINNQIERQNNEKQEQFKLLEEQRRLTVMMIQKQQFTNYPQQQQKLQSKESEKKRICGPMVTSMSETNLIHAETALQQYASKIKQQADQLKNSVDRKLLVFQEQDGIYFVRPEDVERRQFIKKGQTNGNVQKVIISGKNFGMKNVTALNKDQLDKVLDIFRMLNYFSQPNLRKTLGFLIEKLDTKSINLGLIYDFTQYNLYHLENNTEIDFAQRLQVAVDITGAVSFLHSYDTFHGNLKPSNILINFVAGQIYGSVTDWELTSQIYPLISNEPVATLFGWSAPEIMNGSGQLTQQVDIWALGMLFLFIFFNTNVSKQNPPELIKNIYEQQVITLEEVNCKASDENSQKILELTLSMITQDPKKRVPLQTILKFLLLIQEQKSPNKDPLIEFLKN